jgi:sulfur-oxidizing protein SoxZ
MSRFGKAWVRFAESAAPGQAVEIRAMIIHPHESGFRLDNVGRPIPRNIVTAFTCKYAGRQVFRAQLHPAMSTNPYFVFSVIAQETGDLVFEWTDDHGDVATHTAPLNVNA